MRVLCVGDSLGLPREECPYELTWYYKMKEAFPQDDFVDYFTRGLVIHDALHRYDTYYQYYKSEVVIIQTGIVDCAPRYIRENKRSIRLFLKIIRCLGLEDIFWKLVKKGKRKADCVYTPYDVFFTKYNQLVDSFITNGAKLIILISIGHATQTVLRSSPFFNSNADRYNSALTLIQRRFPKKVVIVNPLDNVVEDDFVDGYHCSPQGMNKVFSVLKDILLSYAGNR